MTAMPDRIRAFYSDYMPLGDRLGEIFYAIWMVVVSLGILGGTGFEGGAIIYVIIIAFIVNLTWGLIDGITVMYSNIIERARYDRITYDLQITNDEKARTAAFEVLGEGITGALNAGDREKVLDMIAMTGPGENPRKKRYYPERGDWYYALGIIAIDVSLVVPLIIPFFILREPSDALYVSRVIATIMFAALGVAYAKELNRRRWLAALFLGTLCFGLFSLVYLAGW